MLRVEEIVRSIKMKNAIRATGNPVRDEDLDGRRCFGSREFKADPDKNSGAKKRTKKIEPNT